MTIQCDTDINQLLAQGLIEYPDYDMVNPASLDIRVGRRYIREVGHGRWEREPLPEAGLKVEPGDFLLVDTLESFAVPNGYAMALYLKSSTARRGWDHSLAFWVDPGWTGVLTMEVKNVLQYNPLTLRTGQRFAQAVIHKLSGPSARPYDGRYNGATGVEEAK